MLVKNDLNTPRRWVNGTLETIEKLEKDKIFAKINGKTHEVKKRLGIVMITNFQVDQ